MAKSAGPVAARPWPRPAGLRCWMWQCPQRPRFPRVPISIAELAKEVESPAGTVPMLPGSSAPADGDAWGKPLAASGLRVSSYGDNEAKLACLRVAPRRPEREPDSPHLLNAHLCTMELGLTLLDGEACVSRDHER